MNKDEREKLRTWIEIDTKAIAQNYKTFRKLLNKNTKLMSVVKSNAYGHNLVEISKELDRNGIDWLGVDSIVEGVALRSGGVKKPILVLGYTLPVRVSEAIKHKISLTLSDFESLKRLKKDKNLKGLRVHIKIDTGLHRQGFYIDELPKLIKELKNLDGISVEGIYTHFSSAKNPKDLLATENQIEKFKEAIYIFEKARYKNLIKHASATGGTLIFKEAHFDMVRIGIGMYGLWPSKETEDFYKSKIKLRPALCWKTIVSQIKIVSAGSGIGYDLTEKVSKDTKIAILPVGYWHGFPRALSGVGHVLVKGRRAKVLGRVSMDMIVVNVTDIRGVKIGDEVVLLGGKEGNRIYPDDVANKAHSSSYELITCLNPLIRRIMV